MLRKLTALAAGVAAGLMVLSAFAQTTPPKKKKKPKHKTAAPAAEPAPTAPAATASPELYKPPPEAETPAPSPSAAPASEPTTPSAATPSTPAAEPPAPADKEKPEKAEKKPLPAFSLAAMVGWGYDAGARFGFGARVGYTLPFHLYVGATFIYHLGETEGGSTANFFYPGGELGCELTFGALLLRPYVGAGALALQESIPPAASDTQIYFAAWPGLTAAYAITPSFFVGGDVRYVLSSSYDMLGLFATVGARF